MTQPPESALNDRHDHTPIQEPENALPQVTLDQLPAPLQRAAARMGWAELMPVQAMTFPYIMEQRDLMIQSRTGSGKTGAFVLPILARIDPRQATCQALVLVPTRELAQQVAEQAELLAAEMGVRTTAIYGGVGYGPQLAGLRAGAHLVVGTPGRILDHLLRRSLSLEHLQVLVFDEADRMLSMGFYPDMERIQGYLPRRPISGYMFSATFPAHVLSLADRFLRSPELLSLSRDHVHVTDVEHVYYQVPAMDKDRCLVRIIETENPPSALLFCNTRQRVHYVTVVLQRFGYDADELSSDLSQAERMKVLDRVREGSLRFLVATDVAARGIDLPELSHVILYEVPDDPELYIHRAGRTGRAGAGGTAISLVDVAESASLRQIARQYEIEMEKAPLPSEEDLQKLVAERALVLLEAEMRGRDRLKIERLQRFLPLAQELAHSEDGLALLALLLDDAYHLRVHKAAPIVTPPRVERHPAPRPSQEGTATQEGGDPSRRRRRPRRRRPE
jgi:ATP-dependent RNA helicase DeaD